MAVINRLYQSDCRRAKRFAARHRLQAGLLLGAFLFVPARVSGQATFSEAKRFEEGVPVHAVAVTDFDGDGDVAVSRFFLQDDSLSWYENPGDAPVGVPEDAWSLHEIASLGNSRVSVLKAADLDGDEDPDFVTLEGGTKIGP